MDDNRLADRLIDMAMNQAINNLFGSLLGAFGGGIPSGGMGLPMSGGMSRLYHNGGIIGEGGAFRYVHPAYFEYAPRMHSGGMLRPGEVPFIGLKGERVLNRQQTKEWNAGSAREPSLKVYITNNAAADVKTGEPRREADGGMAVDVVIDSIVADKLGRPGSQSNKMLRAMGVDHPMNRRSL